MEDDIDSGTHHTIHVVISLHLSFILRRVYQTDMSAHEIAGGKNG